MGFDEQEGALAVQCRSVRSKLSTRTLKRVAHFSIDLDELPRGTCQLIDSIEY